MSKNNVFFAPHTDEFRQEFFNDEWENTFNSIVKIDDGLPDPEPMEIDSEDSSCSLEEEPSRSTVKAKPSSSMKAVESSSSEKATLKDLGAKGVLDALQSGEKEGKMESIFEKEGIF